MAGIVFLTLSVLGTLQNPLQLSYGLVAAIYRLMQHHAEQLSWKITQLLQDCMREQLVEDILCFLHHQKDELKSRNPSLFNTLCTISYLDLKKTTCCFHMLVKDIWKVMPQSHHL
ncbi:inositol 1,4,5-trisphosphate receptor-interacting protein-like 1 [Rhynochetos jubatus]